MKVKQNTALVCVAVTAIPAVCAFSSRTTRTLSHTASAAAPLSLNHERIMRENLPRSSRKRRTNYIGWMNPIGSHATSPRNRASALDSSHASHTAYDPLNNRHSASDWLYNVRSLPQSKVLREIRNPVLAVLGWSLFVSVVHKGLVHWGHVKVAAHLCIPGTAHSFLVSALGLLLVFRTNSAYQRFNEGRKIWENILSVSRNMSRMISLYATEVGPENQKRITNLVAAYPYLLRQHIRPGCLCSDDFDIPPPHRLLLHEQRHMKHETRHEGQDQTKRSTIADSRPTTTNGAYDCWVDKRALPWSLFLPQSLPAIARTENRPLWVCDRMAALICQIPYGPNFTSRERLTLLGMVDKLTNAVGQCERIHQTAVPLNYARHSLRSLTLWLFTLPFCLVNDLGLFTAPANAAIAWLFFGVYQIGYSIEDPFQGSLRLSILCDAIRRSVIRQTTDMADVTFPDDPLYQSVEAAPSEPSWGMEATVSSQSPSTTGLFASSSESRIAKSIQRLRQDQRHKQVESGCDDHVVNVPPVKVKRVTEDMTKSLQDEIQQQLSLPTPSAATPVPLSRSLLDESDAVDDVLDTMTNTSCELPLPLTSGPPSPPLWIDEELLHVPKIVRRHSNGTWTEVGI